MTGRLVPRWFMVTAQTAARRVLADRSSSVVSLSIYVTVVVVISSLWRAAAEPTTAWWSATR